MTDDEKIDTSGEKIGSTFLKVVESECLTDIESTKPIESEFTYKEQELSLGNEKETRVFQLLVETDNLKSSTDKWKKKIPAKNGLFSPVTNESIAIKAMKNTAIDKFVSKILHEVFEENLNAELMGMILTETNRLAAQKNPIFVLSMADLNTFHAILVMRCYQSLPRTRLY